MGRKKQSIFSLLNNEEWLRHKYTYMTTAEIGKIVGCNKRTVIYALKRLGIDVSGRQTGSRNHRYGKSLSDELKEKIRQSMIGESNHFYGKHHSPETKKILHDIKVGRSWGNHSEAHKQKMSKLMSEKWKNPEYASKVFKSLNASPNTAELKINGILQKNFPNEWCYNGNCSCGVVIGGMVPDFVNVDGKKIVIEVFGRAFHDPDKSFMDVSWKQQEFGRKAMYSQYGYNCIILWINRAKDISENDVIKEVADI